MRHDPESRGMPPDGRPMDEQPRWRRDFAIDIAEDAYVARRDFVKFLTLTSCTFAVGQLWIGARSAAKTPSTERRIASLANLPLGGTLRFFYPGAEDPCLLLRPDADTLLAYSQTCTHLSCAVQPDLRHKKLLCPCHHGVFDLDTGRVLAGPPVRPLPRIILEVRGDDVYAIGVELSAT